MPSRKVRKPPRKGTGVTNTGRKPKPKPPKGMPKPKPPKPNMGLGATTVVWWWWTTVVEDAGAAAAVRLAVRDGGRRGGGRISGGQARACFFGSRRMLHSRQLLRVGGYVSDAATGGCGCSARAPVAHGLGPGPRPALGRVVARVGGSRSAPDKPATALAPHAQHYQGDFSHPGTGCGATQHKLAPRKAAVCAVVAPPQRTHEVAAVAVERCEGVMPWRRAAKPEDETRPPLRAAARAASGTVAAASCIAPTTTVAAAAVRMTSGATFLFCTAWATTRGIARPTGRGARRGAWATFWRAAMVAGGVLEG
jgi:hypothetical protein